MNGSPALKRPRPSPREPALVPGSLNFRRFALITCAGALGGLVIPSLGPMRQPALVLLFLGLSATLIDATVRRRFTFAWGITAFLCALEPAFRTHALVIPYLALDYLLLACGALIFALSRPRKGAHVLPVIAYAFYIALEIAGSAFAQRWSSVRSIVLPSLLLLLFVVNSRRVRLTPSGTTFVLASYIAGAVTLAGFALRAYFAGDIVWGTQSNIGASGGMPPNHISVLLALAVFASIVLAESAPRLQRLAILGVATLLGSLMVLTFSRGGTVIVLGSLLVYYIILRPTSRRTIVALVAIALMGLAISYAAREITGGKITERYGRNDTSNRYTIAVQGWGIFLENPVLGVGTSNFQHAITETEYGAQTGAHNELIRAAAEHGVLGLVTWLLFIGSTFVVAARRHEMVPRSRRGLRIVILVFAVNSMFYNGLKLAVQPMLVLLALSAFSALDDISKAKTSDKRPGLT